MDWAIFERNTQTHMHRKKKKNGNINDKTFGEI